MRSEYEGVHRLLNPQRRKPYASIMGSSTSVQSDLNFFAFSVSLFLQSTKCQPLHFKYGFKAMIERESICLADCVCERGLAKFRERLEILLGLDRLCVSFVTERFGWD